MLQNESILSELRNVIGGTVIFAETDNQETLQNLFARYYGRGKLTVVTDIQKLSHFKTNLGDEYIFAVSLSEVDRVENSKKFTYSQSAVDNYAVSLDYQQDEHQNFIAVYTATKLQSDLRNYEKERRAVDIDNEAEQTPTPKIILPN